MVGRAAAAQLVHDRLVHGQRQRVRGSRSIPGHRRVAAHAAGVRALVAVEDPLVVLGGRHRHGALAVAQGEQRQLLAVEELLEHHARLAEAALTEERLDRLARLGLVLADDHALARGQHVGLEHGRVRRARKLLLGLLAAAQHHVRGRGDAHVAHQLLAYAFEPSMRRPPRWAERRDAGLRQRVHETGHQRRLGADHHQVDARRAPRARSRPRRRPRPAGTGRGPGRCPRCRARPAAPAAAGCAAARGRARARDRRRRPRGPASRASPPQSAAMKSSIGIAMSDS